LESARGAIHIPAAYKDEPREFLVLAVGPGKLTPRGGRVPLEVGIGDRVICQSYTTGPFPMDDGLPRKLITDDQILAVIPKQQP
jgi:chaperonin GroES